MIDRILKRRNKLRFLAVSSACNHEASPEEIYDLWKRAFTSYLRYRGFNKTAREALWFWGRDDFVSMFCHSFSGTNPDSVQSFDLWGHNWTKLHMSPEEKTFPYEQLIDRFSGDVSYTSDRMSLDRLFRCHWTFGCAMRLKCTT